MAKAKSALTDAIKYAPGRQTRTELVNVSDTLTFKEVNHHIIITKKIWDFPKTVGAWSYQKDLFCYADLLYKSMTRAQKQLWLSYYRAVKWRMRIAASSYEKKRSSRFAKKYWGYHNFALWVHHIFHDMLGDWQWYWLNTRVMTTNVDLLKGDLLVHGWIISKDQLEMLMEKMRLIENRLAR